MTVTELVDVPSPAELTAVTCGFCPGDDVILPPPPPPVLGVADVAAVNGVAGAGAVDAVPLPLPPPPPPLRRCWMGEEGEEGEDCNITLRDWLYVPLDSRRW